MIADLEAEREYLLGFARRRFSRCSLDPEDAVQETFLRVLKVPDQFQGRTALRSYLITTLMNVFKMDVRSGSRREARDKVFEAGRECPRMPDYSLMRKSDERGRIVRLKTALTRLTERQRSVLQLRAEGRTMIEVAEALGLTVGAAKTHASRGRKMLTKILADDTLLPPETS